MKGAQALKPVGKHAGPARPQAGGRWGPNLHQKFACEVRGKVRAHATGPSSHVQVKSLAKGASSQDFLPLEPVKVSSGSLLPGWVDTCAA